MDSLVDEIVNEPGVGELLAPANPIVTPALLINSVLRVESIESVTQAEIESSVRGIPKFRAHSLQ